MHQIHPLTALSEEEIRQAASLIRRSHEAGTKLRFKGISLLEPRKNEFCEYLKAPADYLPARKAWVNYYLVGTPKLFEVVADLTADSIETHTEVSADFHGQVDDEEVLEVERLTLEDPRVQAEIEKLKLPTGAVVVCDPWIW